MMRHTDRPVEETLVYTALEEVCPDCQRVLPVYQVISRPVQCVDRAVLLKRRDKRCRPVAREVCELVRVNSRVSGKAPLDPAEQKRHERLEDLRTLVDDARKNKPRRPRTAAAGPGWTS